MTINIVIAGVGGQGTLLASRILGAIAIENGWDVRVSEVHGMSQRGGNVTTYVRVSPDEALYSTIVEQKQADFVLAFESLEALRVLPYLKEDGLMIVNEQRILPMPVIVGAEEYPADTVERVRASANTVALDALSIAEGCGSIKAVNVVLLGVLAKHMPFSREQWENAIKTSVKEGFFDINVAAFDGGYML